MKFCFMSDSHARKIMISPCGMDCNTCIRNRAVDDRELQALISGKKNIPASSSYCSGCRTVNTSGMPGMEKQMCRIFQCCNEKKFHYCYECEAFPCSMINSSSGIITDELGYYKIINLSILKENGEETLKNVMGRSKKFQNCIPNCPCL